LSVANPHLTAVNAHPSLEFVYQIPFAALKTEYSPLLTLHCPAAAFEPLITIAVTNRATIRSFGSAFLTEFVLPIVF
jgi:hypothetical protein